MFEVCARCGDDLILIIIGVQILCFHEFVVFVLFQPLAVSGVITLYLLLILLLGIFGCKQAHIFDVIENPLVIEILQLLILASRDRLLRPILLFHFVQN